MNTNPAMNNPRTERFGTLIGDLQNDIKTLIRKEIELARTEMSEKMSVIARNAAFAAVGGVLGVMAGFMVLLGVGAIIARLLITAGLSSGAAYFVAYMGLALLVGGVGYFFVHKALHALSQMSFAPEKTLVSVQAAEPVPIHIKKKVDHEKQEHKASSDELQSEVIAARTRMDSEIEELKARLTPGYVARSLVSNLKDHPLRTVILSASTGLGGYLYWRKQQRVAMIKKQAGGLRRWWLNFRMRHA